VAAESLGLEDVGVENMTAARATREAAGLTNHEVNDVWDFDFTEPHEYRGLIASPPCQTFSRAGKGAGREALDDVLSLIEMGVYKDKAALREVATAMGDERTALVLMPLHAAYHMNPEFIALEQVPSVLPVWEAYAEVLEGLGYEVWTGLVNSEQHGVPQTRKRAILIASRVGPVGPPVATHSRYHSHDPNRLDDGVPKWVSMAEALSGWQDEDLVGFPRRYDGQGVPVLLDGVEYRERDLRAAERPSQVVTEKARSWNRYEAMGDVYNSHGCIREMDQPAPTLTASMDNGNFRFIPTAANEGTEPKDMAWVEHRPSPTIVGSFAPDVVAAPGYRKAGDGPRQKAKGSVRVSVEEAGVLQSFPANYPWQGSKTSQYLQVGNAIPPLMALAILKVVINSEGNTNGTTP
jgi:DNA (cytosine-5)-methyltransferase 1